MLKKGTRMLRWWALAALLILGLIARTTHAAHAEESKAGPNNPTPLTTQANPMNGVAYDSDWRIAGSSTALNYFTMLAEGWIHLDPPQGATSLAKGFFIDNLAGGKKYPSSGNTTQITVNTHLGLFVIDRSNGHITIGPKKLGADATFYTGHAPHLYTSAHYTFMANAEVGLGSSITGTTLDLTYDQWGYIVTSNTKNGAKSALTGKIGIKNFVAPINNGVRNYTNNLLMFSLRINGTASSLVAYTLDPTGKYSGEIVMPGASGKSLFYAWSATPA